MSRIKKIMESMSSSGSGRMVEEVQMMAVLSGNSKVARLIQSRSEELSSGDEPICEVFDARPADAEKLISEIEVTLGVADA